MVDSSVWIDFFAGSASPQTDTLDQLLGKEMAIKSAENFCSLRKKGITIRKTADVIIASFCIQNRLPLLFSDRNFKPFVDHLGMREARAL